MDFPLPILKEAVPSPRFAMAIEILCSCGRTAVIAPNDRGVYSCDDPTWKYDGAMGRLWHCGEEGHYQQWARDCPGNRPAEAAEFSSFARALSLRNQVIGKLESWDLVAPSVDPADPILQQRIGALWRECARKLVAAAALVDPREADAADPVKELFR